MIELLFLLASILLIKKTLKGRIPVIYARVSTKKQKGTLPDQVNGIKNELIALGIKKEPVVFMEQVSGSKRADERPQLQAMLDYLEGKDGKAAIVVRDTQRISRNPWVAGAIYDPLRRKDIPLVSLEAGGKVASTDKTPQTEGDLIMPILTAIGGQELSIRAEQTAKGEREAKEKGIAVKLGTPISLYADEALNPWDEMFRYVPMMAQEEITRAEVSRRLGRSTGWVSKARKRIEQILSANPSGKLLRQWLKGVDMVREMEKKHGVRFGKNAKKPMKAVGRMTDGFILKPWDYSPFNQSDLDEYFENYKVYLKKRK
jgi:DNA invertase Pin-like site-specific DNA recombinase